MMRSWNLFVLISFITRFYSCFSSKESSMYLNIYGDQLQPCSTAGMALAGRTSTGFCTEKNDVSDSRHICIDLSKNNNFCTFTNQNRNWCSDSKPCDDGYGQSCEEMCPIENWCTCQWNFALYLQNVGGCNYVNDLQCNAINMQTIKAYVNKISNKKDRSKRIYNALNCIVSKCGLSDTDTLIQMYSANRNPNGPMSGLFFTALIVCVAGYTLHRRISRHGDREEIIMNTNDPDDYFAMGKTLWKGKWIETACF